MTRTSIGNFYVHFFHKQSLASKILLACCLFATPLSHAATCVSPPSGIIDWWPGDGNTTALVGTNNGTLSGAARATAAGFIGQTFTFDGTNGFVQIPDSPILRPTNFTVECWVRFDGLDTPALGGSALGIQYLIFKQNSRSGNFEGIDLGKSRVSGSDAFDFTVTSSAGTSVEVRATTPITVGTWYHVAAVRGPNYIQIYVNGQMQGQATVTFPQDYGTLPLFFGTSGQSYWDHKFKGALDEVTFYNRPLTTNEIAAIYNAGPAGKCKAATPPGITTQPQNVTVVAGSNAQFNVVAGGTLPLSYQWWFGDTTISGATASALTVSNVQNVNGGNYSVVVTNSAGAITSSVAVLTILNAPFFSAAPQNTTNLAGTTAGFSSTITGSTPIVLHWRFNSTNLIDGGRISGAQTANLSIANVQPADAGNYTLVASNAAGAASVSAALVVNGPPFINTPPTGQTAIAGANAQFSVAAGGTQPLSYQWWFGSAPIDGAVGTSVSLNNVQDANSGNYFVVITNVAGAITSSVAALTVIDPPVFTLQPQNASNVVGTIANFSGTAAGTTPITYQWRFNSNNLANSARISGAQTANLTISNVQPADAGIYTLVASNAAGSASSAVASLSVLIPPSVTTQPTNQNVLAAANVTFMVGASGTTPLSYSWLRNGTPLSNGGNVSGAGSSTLTLSNVQTNDSSSFQAVITNAFGSATSSVAVLTVTTQGSCLAPPSGLVSWWTGDGNAGDIFGAHNGTLQGNATATAVGMVGQGFSFDGTNSFVQIPDSPSIDLTNFTIEAWVKFNGLDTPSLGGSPAGSQYIIFKQNTRSGNFEGIDISKGRISGGDIFSFTVTSSAGISVEVRSTTLITVGTWYHLAAVRTPNAIQIYVNGQMQAQAAVTFAQNYGTLPLYFGTSGQAYWDHKFKGNLDEVSMYNRPLTAAEVSAVFAAGAGGKCKGNVAPTIITPPVSQTLVLGGSASFFVTAAGSPTLKYFWMKDGFGLTDNFRTSGSSNSAVTISGLQSGDIGNYQAVVFNPYGFVTSTVASLSTGLPPTNDNFIAAAPIAGSSGSISGNNANATKESGEPNHSGKAGGNSVWYNWTAPSTSPVTFDTAMSAFDTLLAVYTGNSVGSLATIASNDNATTNTSRSRVTFAPVFGTVYHIAVDGNGGNGNLTLRWAQASVALPDLSVVASAVNAHVTTETFATNSCAVLEGLIQPGTRRLLRFDTQTENSGGADLFFGNPANNPLFVYAPCHAHYHFQNYMAYRLRDGTGKIAALGLKVGFCILDVFRWSATAPNNAKYSCSNQGIQVGWGDIYDATLDGQWIDITGLPNGNYVLELEPNPQGIIQESNYGNNIAQVNVSIGDPTAPPANDNFSSPQTLLGGFTSVSGSNTNATKEAGEPNHAGNAGGRSVWYQWTAPSTKQVTLDTIGSTFNSLLAVYTGTTLANLSLVASNDDISPGVNTQSQLTFNATAGVNYRIALDGFNGAQGNVVLTLDQTIQNDNFGGCVFVGGVSGVVHGSNLGATKESGEPNHAANPGGASVWYCWTAPISGTAAFDTIGSTFNTVLAVYTGNTVGGLTQVASNDDIDSAGGNLQSQVSFPAVGLTMYHIAIDGFNGVTGDTTLNWNLSSASQSSIVANFLLPQSPITMKSFPGAGSLTYAILREGEFQVVINGAPTRRYRVDKSCDLVHWVPLAPTLTDGSGRGYFTDKTAMHSATISSDPVCNNGQVIGVSGSAGEARFYRAIPLSGN